MGTQLARELPDAFDRVQFRAVGRQEGQREHLPPLREVRTQQRGVMVPRVVQHHDEPPRGAAMAQERAKKGTERDRIEGGAELGDQLPGAQIDRPEEGHGLPRRRLEQHGVRLFRGHPHRTAGAMLLEVAFVQAPEVTPVDAGESAEFFYMRPGPPGPRGRSAGVASAAGTPAAGTGVDTGARPGRHHAPAPDDERGASRPRGSGGSRTPVGGVAAPG